MRPHNEPSSHAIYTRHFGVAKSHRTYVYTPHCPGNVDLVVVGRSIVGARVDGRVEIPQSGFVISLPIGEVQGQSPGDFEVRYEFANSELDTVSEGLQCGPTLVEDGQISLLRRRSVWRSFSRRNVWVAPSLTME